MNEFLSPLLSPPMQHACPALFVSAPASGQGKTTVTAALARLYRQQGKRVRVFKTGPDFLDPLILQRACGGPVYQLDLWMGGEQHCRDLLHAAAAEADVILVEGVMGLFDGEPSGADLAALFDIPVLAVIDASAMAQTFGAVAQGLARYRAGLRFSGVLANRVGSAGHADMLRESLPPDLAWYGALMRDDDIALPSRHLGLFQANEIADLDRRIDRAASMLAGCGHDALPAPVLFDAIASADDGVATAPGVLAGVRIAIACDAAFAFLYHANLDLLTRLGARLSFFSPLQDLALPPADALYFPGGYPELHAAQLAENGAMKQAIREHHAAGKPIVAECGGMLYLLESLITRCGKNAAMVGLLPGIASMMSRLVNLGMHEVELPEGLVRGHTFHHSRTEMTLPALTHTRGRRGKPEPVFRQGRLHASYLHMYFPSNPAAVARLFAPAVSQYEI